MLDLAVAPRPHHAPLSQEELPTTDPSIAVPNFEGLLQAAKQAAAARPKDPPPPSLPGLYLMQAQVFGDLDAYDRALDAAERIARAKPKDWEAALSLASALSALHLFDRARAEVERAERLAGKGAPIDAARASILQATGRVDEALAIRKRLAAERPTLGTLGLLAATLGDAGQIDDAEQSFVEAQYHFPDVSPFPVVWLYFQFGLMEQKLGRLSTARELFEAAHERLPDDVQAASHLAAVLALTGERERAVALLRPLVEKSSDPELAGQLAELDAQAGAKAEAEALKARAQKRYDELTAKHPEAFSDHAARFWMGPGGDAKKALTLAERNLKVRKTREAYELTIEAATAAKVPQVACARADEALALPHVTAALHLAAARAYEACGEKSRSDAELAAASK